MFIAHFGLALATRRIARRPSLGTLILAAQFLDLVWPVLVLAGIERVEIRPGATHVTPLDFVHYPYSHSLVAALAWGAVVGGAYFALRRDPTGAGWLGALVVSHWVLDFVSHRPDLPLWPGGPRVGLGLWFSVPWTMLAEFGTYLLGVALYTLATRRRDGPGRWLLVALVATLCALYLGAVFGAPPPSVDVLAMSALAGGLFVAWGYAIDAHREVRTPA